MPETPGEGDPDIITMLTHLADPTRVEGTIEPPIERELDAAAAAVDGHSDRGIRLAAGVGRWLPQPGSGSTALRWRSLTALGAGDLTAARIVEAHTDAVAILAEAAADPAVGSVQIGEVGGTAHSTWGVFAAEGPGVRVDAVRNGDRWLLTGTKPWCSLAGRLSHALITAHTPDGARRLFAIGLRGKGVQTSDSGWVARGLADVPSGPIDLVDVAAVPVGPDGWYLRRHGFAWGGIGVAACWYGGAVGLARTMRDALSVREPDQIAAMHLGAVDAALTGARAVLAEAAVLGDSGAANGADGVLLAARVRAIVARAAEDVLRARGTRAGPGAVGTRRAACPASRRPPALSPAASCRAG